MKRKEVVTGIVGIVVGFILGFFVALGTGGQGSIPVGQQNLGDLPEDHPSSEDMERLQSFLVQAEAEPNNRDVRVALGNTYYDMGRFDAAIPWYEEALNMDPNDVMVSTDLGTAYLYSGDTAKAVERYQGSLTIEADHPQTLQNLGIAHFSLGEYQEAIDVWQNLIANHPDYPHAEELKQQMESARAHIGNEAQASE